MKRDKRYGAALALAALFFGFFLLSRADLTVEDRSARADGPPPASAGLESIRALMPVFPVNINTATADDLKILPGIGTATAGRILEKRDELGGFTSVEQLTEVRWVGKVKLERMRGLVSVE